jgi:hypothetical protein
LSSVEQYSTPMHKTLTKTAANVSFQNAHNIVVLSRPCTDVEPAVSGCHKQKCIATAELFDFHNIRRQDLGILPTAFAKQPVVFDLEA